MILLYPCVQFKVVVIPLNAEILDLNNYPQYKPQVCVRTSGKSFYFCEDSTTVLAELLEPFLGDS